jgi:thiamine-monophosphate kinase
MYNDPMSCMHLTPYPSSEYALVSRLQSVLGGTLHSDYYPTGIGDDAAVRREPAGNAVVLTTDLSVENVHFSLSYMTIREVGYRAMVSNLSDCAAMGALPDSALVQLVIPKKSTVDGKEMITQLYDGFGEACRHWNFPIVGGDLSLGEQWVIGITLLGRVSGQERAVLRKGARSGDTLWISAAPGRSAAGLSLLQNRVSDDIPPEFASLVAAHLRPVPRIELGRSLAADPAVHAMMDCSDGLSKDCRTLSYENGCGIILSTDSSQVPHEMIQFSRETDCSWEDWFFHGGEDYELLFAASPDFVLSRHSAVDADAAPLKIGLFSSSVEGVVVDRNGVVTPLGSGGFDHLSAFL